MHYVITVILFLVGWLSEGLNEGLALAGLFALASPLIALLTVFIVGALSDIRG